MIHISKGNKKLGGIPNISMPPVVSCQPNVPCAKMCYAQKAYRLYPTVKQAWNDNFKHYQEHGNDYFVQIYNWLHENRSRYFRWHVSGDVPDKNYFEQVFEIAHMFPLTKFMIFTKRWDLIPDQNLWSIPSNLAIILSMWPGLLNPKAFENFTRAWLSTDKRKPDTYFKCHGSCESCKHCWVVSENKWDVVFDPH